MPVEVTKLEDADFEFTQITLQLCSFEMNNRAGIRWVSASYLFSPFYSIGKWSYWSRGAGLGFNNPWRPHWFLSQFLHLFARCWLGFGVDRQIAYVTLFNFYAFEVSDIVVDSSRNVVTASRVPKVPTLYKRVCPVLGSAENQWHSMRLELLRNFCITPWKSFEESCSAMFSGIKLILNWKSSWLKCISLLIKHLCSHHGLLGLHRWLTYLQSWFWIGKAQGLSVTLCLLSTPVLTMAWVLRIHVLTMAWEVCTDGLHILNHDNISACDLGHSGLWVAGSILQFTPSKWSNKVTPKEGWVTYKKLICLPLIK